MPASRTAQDIVDGTRQELAQLDTSRIVDGFTADRLRRAPALSILSFANRVLTDLCETGFNKCTFSIDLISLTSEYLFTRQASDILSSFLEDSASQRVFPLSKDSVQNLDSRWQGGQWRSAQASRPISYYPVGTRGVGFYPKPILTTLTAKFLATALIADMALPTDYPGQVYAGDGITIVLEDDALPATCLPEQHHDTVIIGTAARIARSLGNTDLAGMLFAEYGAKKQELRKLVNARAEIEDFPIVIRTARSSMYYDRLGVMGGYRRP